MQTETVSIALQPTNAEELTTKTTALEAQAAAFKIVTYDDFTRAGAELQTANALGKLIDETFAPIVKAAHDTHKQAIAIRDAQLKPVENAKQAYKLKIADFHTRMTSVNRLWSYVGAYAAQAEAEAARRAEEDRKLEQAAKLEQAGHGAIAEKIVEQVIATPAPAPVIPITSATPATPKGVSFRETWKFEVTDKRALIEAALADERLMALVAPDEKAIGQWVRAQKGSFKVPGVRVYQDTGVAVR